MARQSIQAIVLNPVDVASDGEETNWCVSSDRRPEIVCRGCPERMELCELSLVLFEGSD